jgi:hypothetical protein
LILPNTRMSGFVSTFEFTDMFSGTLTPFPVQLSPIRKASTFTDEAIILDSVSLTDQQNKTTALSQPGGNTLVVLDTGAQTMTLPDDVFKGLQQYVGAIYFPQFGIYGVDCNITTLFPNSYVSFAFGTNGFKINVPIPSLALPLNGGVTQEQAAALGSPFQQSCLFGASGAATGNLTVDIILLGASFLRSAYAVFDQTNNQISLAQAIQTSASQVIELQANGVPAAGIPGAPVSTNGTKSAGDSIHAYRQSSTILAASIFFAAFGASALLS